MFSQFNAEFNKLNYIVESLGKQGKIEPEEYARLREIINNVTPENLQESLHILQHAVKRLEGGGKVDAIRASLLGTQAAATATLSSPKTETKIGLELAILSDFACKDHNGAIRGILTSQIVPNNIPFITTRSLLNLRGAEETNVQGFHNELLQSLKDWDIFALPGQDLVLCLPKSVQGDLPYQERLKMLDFSQDLQPVSLSSLFHSPPKTTGVDTLLQMFAPTSHVDKLFYLAGHGDSTHVGAIDGKQYETLVDHLGTSLGCKGLFMTSCYSAGISSMYSLPQANLESYGQRAPPTFPILTHATGDFVTYTLDNMNQCIQSFKSYIETGQKGFQTFKKELKQAKDEIEAVGGKKPAIDFKMYIPHAPGAPGGYRPLTGAGFSLTQAHAMKAKLEKQPISATGEFLGLHPVVIEGCVAMPQNNSPLRSMLPGASHHYVEEIVCSQEAEALLWDTIAQHQAMTLNVPKAFFIKSLRGSDGQMQDVLLTTSKDDSFILYSKEGKYFQKSTKDAQAKELSPHEYQLTILLHVKMTTPDPEALRVTCGGQQSDRDFLDHVYATFGVSSALAVDKAADMTDRERTMLIQCLLAYGREEEAVALCTQVSTLDRPTLLDTALNMGSEKLALALLDNPNISVGDEPLLQRAVDAGFVKLVEKIFSHADFDESILQVGTHPFLSATRSKEMLQVFLQRGFDVNRIYSKDWTPLSYATKTQRPAAIDLLLEIGSNPNLGKPSALKLALEENNHDLIEKFLLKGGKPFERDASGECPFITALFANDTKIIQTLLARPDARVDVTSAKGESPLAIAIYTGNRAIANYLFEHNATLQNGDEQLLSHAMLRAIVAEDNDQISSILKWTKNSERSLSELFFFGNNEMIAEAIDGGALTDLERALAIAIDGEKVDAVTCLLDKMVALPTEEQQEEALAMAMSKGNSEIVSKLLAKNWNISSKTIIEKELLSTGFDASGEAEFLQALVGSVQFKELGEELDRLWGFIAEWGNVEAMGVLLSIPELRDPVYLLDVAAKTLPKLGPGFLDVLRENGIELDPEKLVIRLMELKVDWKEASVESFAFILEHLPQENKELFIKACFGELLDKNSITQDAPSGELAELLLANKPANFVFDPCRHIGGGLFGTSALKNAVSHGNEGLVKALLAHSSNPKYIKSLIPSASETIGKLLEQAT